MGQRDGNSEKRKQLKEILGKTADGLGISRLPSADKALSGLLSLTKRFSVADTLEVLFHGGLVSSFHGV